MKVNGILLDEALNKLRRAFLPTEFEKKGNMDQYYISYDKLKRRLDESFSDKYEFICKVAPMLVNVPCYIPEKKDNRSPQERLFYDPHVQCIYELRVYDDDGELLYCDSSPGVIQIILNKSSGKTMNLENNFKGAITAAKRNCIKEFIGENAFAKNYNFTNDNASSNTLDEGTIVKVRLKSTFSSKGKFMIATCEDCESMKQFSLVIWNNKIDDIGRNKVNILLNKGKIGKELKCTVSKNVFNGNNQYIVLALHIKEA